MFIEGDQFLASEVATTSCARLVLKVDASSTGTFHFSDHPLDGQYCAETGFTISKYGYRRCRSCACHLGSSLS
jgi:hypothetical protein